MVARFAALFALVLPLVAACGGGTSTSLPPQTPAAGEAPAPTKTLADLKRDFMTDCSSRVPNAPDYCECGWEQTARTFTEADLKAAEADKDKLALLKGRIEGTCKAKLPEDVLKTGFVKGCVGTQPRNTAYCECSWGSFRKSFSASELSDAEVVKSERFTAAKKVSVKACGGKMPEDAARDTFVAACSKGNDALNPVCGCAWKALRGMASVAEIQGDLVDLATAKPVIDKACAKLRPAAH
jgi:hypothetical protein